MFVPNFSYLADLEVAVKFVLVVGGFQVAAVSSSDASCFSVALS